MDCKEFREILDLYVDGELAPEAMSAAHTHLKTCSSCRTAEAGLLHLRKGMKQVVSQHDPPPELLRSVQELIKPRWRRVLTALHIRRVWSGGSEGRAPVWRETITLPAPALILLLMAVIALGTLLLTMTLSRRSRTVSNVPSKPALITPNARQRADDVMDISRFDHGGRATIYKTSATASQQ